MSAYEVFYQKKKKICQAPRKNIPYNLSLQTEHTAKTYNKYMLYSFPPVIGPNTRALIIGSMPGHASLCAGQYYAYKHNAFWRIIFDLFEQGRTPENYEDKKAVILKHSLGLWDTLAACERTGSLDTRITRPKPNDFPALFQKYPAVHTLLFNGTAALRFYKRAFGEPALFYHQLPSTSPAHAGLSYEEKRNIWQSTFAKAGLMRTL